MLQNQVFPNYREDIKELNRLYAYLKSFYNESYADELCAIRGYPDDEYNNNPQKDLIKEMQLGYCEIDDLDEIRTFPESFGLITKKGNFLLNGRFIIPVHTISNDLITLIGYYPDSRKYITLATRFFSKEVMYFNFNQAYNLSWEKYNGLVILVEGIFDCLSLRSIGLPALATMGSTVSKIKGELLKVFRKVLAIPDDDKTGHKALNRYSKYGWHVPDNTTFIKFVGGHMNFNGNKLHCKDIDNFVSWYDADSVREILLSYSDSKEDIVILDLRNDDE